MHGGDIYTQGILKNKKLIDFSSNINPLGLPKSFEDNIQNVLSKVVVYPDVKYRKLKGYLIDYLNFNMKYFYSDSNNFSLDIENENLVLGNGAAEIIDLAISYLDKVTLVVPSFIEYEISCKKWDAHINYFYLNDNMEINYEDLLNSLQNSKGLIIGNPNNPNGGIINIEKFKFILDYCQKNKKIIIVDEAFIEFTGKDTSLLKYLDDYSCLFIIRALTKFFAMPGVRFGYGISKNKNLINHILNKQNPWNVNCFAEYACSLVLNDKEYIDKSISYINKAKSYMIKELQSIEIIEDVYKTYSNFILCKLKKINYDELSKILLKQNIIIRNCSNFKGLDDKYVRFAVKSNKYNKLLIDTLKSI